MSPQRVIRPAARRSPAGAASLLWTGAAAALPVVVIVLVLAALTLGVLVFSGAGVDSLFAVVAVEWLVVNRVPLTVDEVELGFLPLLPPLVYVAILARQTRVVLSDVEQPGAREAGVAVAGATVTGVLFTVLASLLMGSAASDFAVRESSLPVAVLWSLGVGLVGSGLGVWLRFRGALHETVPLWVRGGLHLGAAFVAATWLLGGVLVTVGLVLAWPSVGGALEIGRDAAGMAALTGISVAYLPNVVMAAAALVVGGEAHLGEASFSVFAVSRGPMPEVPLAAALPTTDPHWLVQGLLLVSVLTVAGLARSVAHWFRSTVDAVKAAWLGAVIVALVTAVTPVVAGGELGMLGTVGTGSLIAAVMALLICGIIGSATVALSLAGLTKRRERAESELERRRRRVGTATTAAPEPDPEPGSEPESAGPVTETQAEPGPEAGAGAGAEADTPGAEAEQDDEADLAEGSDDPAHGDDAGEGEEDRVPDEGEATPDGVGEDDDEDGDEGDDGGDDDDNAASAPGPTHPDSVGPDSAGRPPSGEADPLAEDPLPSDPDSDEPPAGESPAGGPPTSDDLPVADDPEPDTELPDRDRGAAD